MAFASSLSVNEPFNRKQSSVYNEDEDAKQSILDDDEGDFVTGKPAFTPQQQNNNTIINNNNVVNAQPKIPPPVINFSHLDNKLNTSKSQSPHSPNSPNNYNNYAPDIDIDFVDTNPKHHTVKSMPIALPEFWTCSICTYAENNINKPFCSMCGALPAIGSNDKNVNNNAQKPQKPQKKKKKKPLSPTGNKFNKTLHQNQIFTRARHNDHSQNQNNHIRAHSAQMSPQQTSNISHMLPNFLELDTNDEKQPSYMKKNSIANLVTKNNPISVLDKIPKAQRDAIIKQLNAISSKKELQIELYSVKMTLQKKIKLHNQRIIAFNKQINKLKTEYERQKKLWNEYYIIELIKLCNQYFNKLFNYIETRIKIENYYLKCFQLKLEKITTSYDKLDETIDDWDISDTREYVKLTMFTISKIRTSTDVHSKKSSQDKIKIQISQLEKLYEKRKVMLNKSKIDHKKRSAQIILFMKGVIDEYNAHNQNIKLTSSYFCSRNIQEQFQSFLLDQRCDVGKIIQNWRMFLLKNINNDVLFKDIYIFIERLINTFCKLYNLEQSSGKYNYREYIMRFVYVSMLNLKDVDKILKKISNTDNGKIEFQSMVTNAEYTLFAHFIKLKYKL